MCVKEKSLKISIFPRYQEVASDTNISSYSLVNATVSTHPTTGTSTKSTTSTQLLTTTRKLPVFERHTLEHQKEIKLQTDNLIKLVPSWQQARESLLKPNKNSLINETNSNSDPLDIDSILSNPLLIQKYKLAKYELIELKNLIFLNRTVNKDQIFYLGQNIGQIPSGNKTANFYNARDETNNFGFDFKSLPGRVAKGGYKLNLHDHILYRYEILKYISEGTFGQVVIALDHSKVPPRKTALKIMNAKKNLGSYSNFEYYAVKFIDRHVSKSTADSNFIVGSYQLHENFRNHRIFVYELLGQDLYKSYPHSQFPVTSYQQKNVTLLPWQELKTIAWDLLEGLAVLDRIELVHNDLKPQNILLTDKSYPFVKIIDYGLGCYRFENFSTNPEEKIHMKCPKHYVVTRNYRSPEVIFGLNYTTRSDMWSFAVILAELRSKHYLFVGDHETDLLGNIMEVLGLPPVDMVKNSKYKKVYFESFNYKNKRHHINKPYSRNLETELILQFDSENDEFENNQRRLMCDLLTKILQWNPNDRLSALQAMAHPWFLEFANDRFDKIVSEESQ